jgi:hypothetical protein
MSVKVTSESNIKRRVISANGNYCLIHGDGVGGEKKLRLV